MKINSIEFSVWYKELTFNPIDKIKDLEQALTSKFTTPFLVNNREPYVDIALPRIVGNNKENDTLFDMTLINLCYQRRYHDNAMMQDAIMEINENLQYFYDVLKDIYDVDALFASIKVDVTFNNNFIDDIAKKYLKGSNNNIEDLVIKEGFNKDDKYYVNWTISANKEISYDITIQSGAKPNEGDMFSRSMITSLKNARVGSSNKNICLEINDRLSYNNDDTYRLDKEKIRDLIYEFKLLFEQIDKY